MTRDTQGLYDDRDSFNDADIHTALWLAAPFPRLPENAPAELKKITIDVDDPKRIYVIHRASRRHGFHLLVERYVTQLRYGCQNKACTTSTCFSCRRRVANGNPVRRYNATSARTLAAYLSSQDNPERGLCPHPSAKRPVQARSISKVPPKEIIQAGQDTVAVGGLFKASSQSKDSFGKLPPLSKGMTSGRHSEGDSKPNTNYLDFLGEPTTVDHKSFVQNLFGTVAFRMLEWLTPRNLQSMVAAHSKDRDSYDGFIAPNEPQWRPESGLKSPERSSDNMSAGTDHVSTDMQDSAINHTEKLRTKLKKHSEPPPCPPSIEVHNKQSEPSVEPRRPSSASSIRPEALESQLARGAVTLSSIPRPPHTSPEKLNLPRDGRMNGSLLKRSTSAQLLVTQSIPGTVFNISETSPNGRSEDDTKPPLKTHQPNNHTDEPLSSGTSLDESDVQSTGHRTSALAKKQGLPQSLSHLPIEVIEFICDTLQSICRREQHLLGFVRRSEKIEKLGISSPTSLRRSGGARLTSSLQQAGWRAFIEQSIFDVLSRPGSLLQSFTDDQILYDTQTIWYLMVRLTQAAPFVVFHSLWNVAGALFRTPQVPERIYDWSKETTSDSSPELKPLSDIEAAHIMAVCLHSLVATAPYNISARYLQTLSRVRSEGLSCAGREYGLDTSQLKSMLVDYDDVFSNELSLRLARRLFSAIPVRRQFTELLSFQGEVNGTDEQKLDILETAISSLKLLDIGSSPLLNFTVEDRNTHEILVPTLLLDWSRTIMFQDWQGTGEVPAHGAFPGALALIAAIYKNRKSLLVADGHFRTRFFEDRLDAVEMPLQWLKSEPNKKTSHLLDYPYLFDPATLVTYFRSINFSRMHQAYDTAKAAYGFMRVTAAEQCLMTDDDQRVRLYDRLKTSTSKYLVLEISRENVLRDTFDAIWRREQRELMRPLKVRLGEHGGEEGMDSGGVQQEYFRLAMIEALNPDNGTFTVDSRTKMTWFLPGSPEPLWKFELIGMIISLAVYNGLSLPVTFPKALYRKLLDVEVCELHHIEDGWPDLANGLTQLLEWNETDGSVEDIFARTYEFSVEHFGQPVSRQMTASAHWPQFSDSASSSNPENAPMVTNDNRNEYVTDYIHWLTDISVRPQFEAFKTGFFACIDRRSIKLFEPETLQAVVEGVQDIDISELRHTVRYIGWDASHRSVRDFWSVVRKYDIEQKKKLLEFVTASDRVPVGGIQNLQFTVQRHGVDDTHLPSSYTCFGILLLPEYSSKEVLKEKLAMALENSKGFGMA